MDAGHNGKNQKKWESPILITVLTAIVGLIGTGVGAIFQGYYEAKLERQKFESQLIFKALEATNTKERAKYLLFLADSGLINSLDLAQIRDIADKPDRIPGKNPELAIKSARDILSLPDSLPGEILVHDAKTWNTWHDRGHIYAASRLYEAGKIIAFGHDDILRRHQNGHAIKESFRWLSGGRTGARVVFSTAHCEWVPTKSDDAERSALYETVRQAGYAVSNLDKRISASALGEADILVIGNAWGSFEVQEVAALEKFVANGGGLFVAGLGWSWRDHGFRSDLACAGKQVGQISRDLATYPMNTLMRTFGVIWTDRIIQ